MKVEGGGGLCFSDKLALESHSAKTVDFAGNVVVTIYQTDVFDLGSCFDRFRHSFNWQVLHNHDTVSVFQDLPIDVFYGIGIRLFLNFFLVPFVAAFWTVQKGAIVVGKCRRTIGASREVRHVVGFVLER